MLSDSLYILLNRNDLMTFHGVAGRGRWGSYMGRSSFLRISNTNIYFFIIVIIFIITGPRFAIDRHSREESHRPYMVSIKITYEYLKKKKKLYNHKEYQIGSFRKSCGQVLVVTIGADV